MGCAGKGSSEVYHVFQVKTASSANFYMRGFLISIAGGIFIPLFLFAFALMAGESLEHWGLGWLANLLMFAIVGPMAIWERVFPHALACPSCGPTDTAIVATLVTVFLFYSISTYIITVVIQRLRHRDVRPSFERRA